MKCQSCSIEIPPVWVAALKNNSCPSCSGKIMSEDLQGLIDGLSTAMEQMPNNPQGVACWIVSNYKLEKINEYEPPQFHQQKKAANININAPNSDKQKSVEEFFARAGVNIADVPALARNAANRKLPPQVPPLVDEPEDFVEEVDEVDRMMFAASDAPISDDAKNEIAMAIVQAKYGAEKNPVIAAMVEKQREKQEMIANGDIAYDKTGKPAGFRRSG